jgi:hypothetical protein
MGIGMLMWCAASASAALPAAAVAVVPDANAIPVWVWSDYKDNADYKTGMPGYMLLCMEVSCLYHSSLPQLGGRGTNVGSSMPPPHLRRDVSFGSTPSPFGMMSA